MPCATRESIGNELFDTVIYLPAVTVPNLPLSTTTNQTIVIQGVLPGDMLCWSWQGNVPNVAIENIFVSAPNTTVWTWSNGTSGAINGTAPQPFLLEVIRPDFTVEIPGISALPGVIQ